MNNLTKIILAAVAGAMAGAGITTYIFKRKENKRIIQAQMDADFDMPEPDEYEDNDPEAFENEISVSRTDEKPPISIVYHQLASKYRGETNDDAAEEDKTETDAEMKEGEDMGNISVPYLISGTEFEDNEMDYEQKSYMLFADGILVDEFGDMIDDDDIDDIVGKDNLHHFGDDPEDPDTIYVRNDKYRTDFEVCQSLENYGE